MASRITNFLHASQTTGTTALTSAYGTARAHDLTEGLPSFQAGAKRWVGLIEGVIIHVHAVSGASSVTVRVTADAAGDTCIIPDTQAQLSVGVTTATVATAVFSGNGTGLTNLTPTQTDSVVYVWVKTDAGTANLKESTIVWRE